MIDASKILVAVPTRGQPRASTVTALQALRDTNPGLPPICYIESRLSVCDGRNRMVREFLATSCEYLITIDDDIVPHKDVLRLASYDRDIVAAPVLICRAEAAVPFPNVYNWNEKQQAFNAVPDTFIHVDKGTVMRCDGAGTGVMAIHRRVFEHPEMRVPFQHKWNEHGEINMTEDLTFCRRATTLGFEVWADYGVFSDQIVNVNITWIARMYAEAMSKAVEAVSAQPRSRLSAGGIIMPEWRGA